MQRKAGKYATNSNFMSKDIAAVLSTIPGIAAFPLLFATNAPKQNAMDGSSMPARGRIMLFTENNTADTSEH